MPASSRFVGIAPLPPGRGLTRFRSFKIDYFAFRALRIDSAIGFVFSISPNGPCGVAPCAAALLRPSMMWKQLGLFLHLVAFP
jgi:hypothetical protein